MHTPSSGSRTVRTACILALGASSLLACSSQSPSPPSESLGSPLVGDTTFLPPSGSGGGPAQGTPISTDANGAISCLATDGTNVFWFDANAGILQAPIAGGGNPVVLMPLQNSPLVCRGMTVANGRVLWITSDTSIWGATVGSAGSGAKIVLVFPPRRHDNPLYQINGLAANPAGTDVYFVVNETPDGSRFVYPEHCSLSPAPTCAPVTQPTVFATPVGSNVLYVGNLVFWDYGNVLSVYSPASGKVQTFFGQGNLVTDGNYVFFSMPGDGGTTESLHALQVTQSGVSLSTTFAVPFVPGGSVGLAADGKYLYTDAPGLVGGATGWSIAFPGAATTLTAVVPDFNVSPPAVVAGGYIAWVSPSGSTLYSEPTP
jgi:hypothetical protein